MKDVLFFDKMLTPKIITFVYWLLIAAVVLGGLSEIFNGNFFLGIGMAVGGAIGVRIWCELLIVAFKINEALQEIRTK